MPEAPAMPFFERAGKPGSTPGPARPRTPTAWSSERVQPIEIVAPDRDSAALLLDYAAPLFPAEIVSGSAWIVRLLPRTGGAWVPELLTLVERWLESVPLPCATVRFGGRSYLIRASIGSS
jgi:hypothetical protein